MLASTNCLKLAKDVAVVIYWSVIARDAHLTIWIDELINELVFLSTDCFSSRTLFHLSFLAVWLSKLGLGARTSPTIGDCLFLDKLLKDALNSLNIFIFSLKFGFNKISIGSLIHIWHLLNWSSRLLLLKGIVFVRVIHSNFVATWCIFERLHITWATEGALTRLYSISASWVIFSCMII